MTPLLQRVVFPRWRPRPELRPRARLGADEAALSIEWLGTAGHVVRSRTTTVLIDPFVSRPGLLRVGLGRLRPDADAIERYVPRKVDAVLLGHSHYDHLMDAPSIARRTGARIVGSRSTAAFARAEGVPESQIVEVPEVGATLRVGDLDIRFVRSRHGRIFFGRVPFPGEVAEAPRIPARANEYRMGGAFGIVLRAPGATLYHNGSADLVDAEIEEERADVVLVGLAGRAATPDYVKRLVGVLRPSLIVPTHHDAFFSPIGDGVRLLPRIDLDAFVEEARAVAPRATLVTPDHLETLCVPEGDARGAGLLDGVAGSRGAE